MGLTKTERTDKNTVQLEIAVDKDEFAKAIVSAYNKNKNRINVPGFRKGHAPIKMIEKMYGESFFFEDAVSEIYPTAYAAAVDESGIEPVDKADVEIVEVGYDKGLIFKATVTVKPEVDIKKYKGISAEKIDATASKDEIDAEIDRLRERNARIVTVERKINKNDIVNINYEGFNGDTPFAGGKEDGRDLTIGSGMFIPGFEEQLIGKKTGDELEINVTFPEDYHEKSLAGKPVIFKVKINEVKEKNLDNVDDEFAKDVSEFNTLDELKDSIRDNIVKAKETDIDNAFTEQLIETIATKHMVADIPECMIIAQSEDTVRDFEYRLSTQGLSLETYLKYTGMTVEKMMEENKEKSEMQVKMRLALEKIAEMENIEVSEEDINTEIKRLAAAYNMGEDEIRKVISVDHIKNDIKTGKAVEIIKENAVVKKPVAKKTAAKKDDSTETPKKPAAKKPAAKKAAVDENEKKPEAKKNGAKDEVKE